MTLMMQVLLSFWLLFCTLSFIYLFARERQRESEADFTLSAELLTHPSALRHIFFKITEIMGHPGSLVR